MSEYCAMLVAKATPNREKPTLLLRFVEKQGCSTMFTVTEKALEQFEQCELYRIYDISVSCKCIRSSKGKVSYGVQNTLEVAMKFACNKLQLSTAAWPLKFPYDMLNWESLNQLEANTFVDLIGKVCEQPKFDANSNIPKLVVPLQNEYFVHEVEFLGNAATLRVSLNDTVALGGAQVHMWKERRTIQTTFLTVIEVNPTSDEVLKHLRVAKASTPKRKAMRMTPAAIFTIDQANHRIADMVAYKGDKIDLAIVCKVMMLNDKFFEDDAPFVDKNGNEIIRWNTCITDNSGEIQVTVWDRAAYELLGVTASKLRSYWEEGVEASDKRAAILSNLNKQLNKEVTCFCQAQVWQYGNAPHQQKVNVNVNAVEFRE